MDDVGYGKWLEGQNIQFTSILWSQTWQEYQEGMEDETMIINPGTSRSRLQQQGLEQGNGAHSNERVQPDHQHNLEAQHLQLHTKDKEKQPTGLDQVDNFATRPQRAHVNSNTGGGAQIDKGK